MGRKGPHVVRACAAGVVVLLGVMAVPLAWGGPLETRIVDGEARWVIHVDVEAALRSAVGRSILTDHRSPAAEGLETLRWRLGISAVNDVKGVTVFGRGECGDPGTIVVDMTAAADGLNTSLPAANLPGYERVEPGLDGQVVHSWKAEGERVFAMVAPGAPWGVEVPEGRLLILGPSLERLERVLRMRSGALAATGPGENLPDLVPDQHAIVFVSAVDLGAFQPSAMLSQKARGLTLNIGERAGPVGLVGADGTVAGAVSGPIGGPSPLRDAAGAMPAPEADGPWFYATARLTTEDEAAAKKASTLIRGVVGVLMQTTESDPRAEHLRAGLSRIRVEALGESVHVTMTEPVAEITSLIREGRRWLPEPPGGTGAQAGSATPGGRSPNTIPAKATGQKGRSFEGTDQAEHRP